MGTPPPNPSELITTVSEDPSIRSDLENTEDMGQVSAEDISDGEEGQITSDGEKTDSDNEEELENKLDEVDSIPITNAPIPTEEEIADFVSAERAQSSNTDLGRHSTSYQSILHDPALPTRINYGL